MQHIRDSDRPIEEWREGVRTRMYASAVTGASQLVVFEQWCDPGHGAPRHRHAVEEVLRVLSGQARIFVADDEALVATGESVIVPAGIDHGFVNAGDDVLHTQAILAAPVFEAHYVESDRASYRWLPDARAGESA